MRQRCEPFSAIDSRPFKVPARFYFQHDQLPRIATGKIAKKELRKQTIALLELA